MKKLLKIKYLLPALVALAVSCVLYCNFKTNTDFFKMDFSSGITVLIGIIISYFLVNRDNNEKNLKDTTEKIIDKIQGMIRNPMMYKFNEDVDVRDIHMTKRAIDNKLNLLKKVSKKLDFENEIEYIISQFDEYVTLVDDHINDIEYLKRSELDLKRRILLIDDKFDEIKLKLYL
ncbi:MAG: hypothetical protein IJX99_07620 [Clostridia bacterium]|nr:hypothetical protein [Clostridia bacterium]